MRDAFPCRLNNRTFHQSCASSYRPFYKIPEKEKLPDRRLRMLGPAPSLAAGPVPFPGDPIKSLQPGGFPTRRLLPRSYRRPYYRWPASL